MTTANIVLTLCAIAIVSVPIVAAWSILDTRNNVTTQPQLPIYATIDIAHTEQYPLLQCDECGLRFVLLAVLPDDKVLSQDEFTHCPYCGHEEG